MSYLTDTIGTAQSVNEWAGHSNAKQLADVARRATNAELAAYPILSQVKAAASMGGKTTINGTEYDFTGLGDADNAGVMSDQMAQVLLSLQQQYGPQFVQQQLEALKQADPQGYAARKQLFDRIMTDSRENPDRPMADDLQQAIVGQLQNAGRLDSRMLQEVQQSVRGGQVARGNYLGNANTAQEAEGVVNASEGLRDSQQQQAAGFLQSGVTPEDVQYRRIQQSLADLGAFQNGTTPQAQFRNISGAGNGAAPFMPGNTATASVNPGTLRHSNNRLVPNGTRWPATVAPVETALSAGQK